MDDRFAKYGWRSFADWPDEEVCSFLAKSHILKPRKLPDGSWIGLCQLMYTLSVCMDITPTQVFTYRWCFADPAEALYLLETAQEFDEVPVRRTSLQGHRYMSGKPLYVETDVLGYAKW